jgi:hypothetical protein
VSDAEAIRADIELTRAELARTVEALHSRLDVKSQARERGEHLVARAAVAIEQNRTALLTGGAVLLALVVFRRGRTKPESSDNS